MLSWNIDTTGQFASVLLQTESSFCFLTFDATVIFKFSLFNLDESAGFSASATTGDFSKKTVYRKKAPKPASHNSQAVIRNLVFISEPNPIYSIT